MSLKLKNPQEFGDKILEQFQKEGWGSLGKRDLELLIYILLEKDGALTRNLSNYDIARQLRITEAKVAGLRRDAYARWRPLFGEDPATVLKRVIATALDQDRLSQSIKFAGKKMKEGFIPLLIEHPDDRAEIEHAIKEAGGIPCYERNREVILVHFETLLQIAERLGTLESDPAKVQKALSELLQGEESLAEFFRKPISNLTASSARTALNQAGAIVIESGLKTILPSFLKLIIPSI